MNVNLPTKIVPIFIVIVVGILYIATLDTGLRPEELTGGDLITHQYAQVQARPSNAPGYPLYTMLGWLWFRLGRALLGWIWNPIQILSFYSTIWGLASLWVLYHLLYRSDVTGRNGRLSALLTLFYAVTYFFWYYSVTTEQYTSAIFQTLLLVWLAFEWEAAPTDRTLLLLAFLSGTMLANMLTTLFILPPLLYLIFTRRPDILKQPRLVGLTILVGLLPVLSYGYIYLRAAQHPEWRGKGDWANTTAWFIDFLSTQQGRAELAPGLTLQNLITPEFPALIWGELTWPVLAGGLIGLALFERRKRLFFYGTLLIYLFFVTAYRFGNWFQVILPFYPLLLIGFGRLLAWLWERYSISWLRSGLVAALALLIGYRFTVSWPRADQAYRMDDTGLDPGWAILADVAEPGWSISATFEEWVALQYLTQIWQAQPMIDLREPGEPADYVSRQAAAAFPDLIDLAAMHPNAVGATLIHRQPTATTDLPASLTPLTLDFGGLMRLNGYSFDAASGLVTLYWQPMATIPDDYTVSVRLLQAGMPIESEFGPLIQDHQPVWNTYPTRLWQPGEVIADAYLLPLPVSARPDQIQIVVYRPTAAGFVNLDNKTIDLK